MSDEAIVRVVLTDSTTGANRTAIQSATTSLTPSSQDSIRPDRLYREISNVPNTINQGFKTSLSPVVDRLTEIRELLDKDYDYSEKEYRESTQQTSLLKIMTAALSGDQGSVAREIQKGLGLKSSDAQIISALKSIDSNITGMKTNLTPEATYRTPTIFDPIVKFMRETTERIKNVDKSMLTTRIATGAIAGYLLTHTEEIAPYVEPGFTAVENLPSAIAQAAPDIKDIGVQVISGLLGNLPELLQTGAVSAIVGAAVGSLLYLILPKKEEKEKSVNELLADISKLSNSQTEIIKNQTIVTYEGFNNQNQYLEQIETNTRIIAENSISLSFQSEQANLSQQPENNLGLEYPGTPFPTLGNVPPIALPVEMPPSGAWNTEGDATLNPSDLGADLRAEHQSSININPPVANENIPLATPVIEPIPDLTPEDIIGQWQQDFTNYLMDEWANWNATYIPGRFLSQNQLQELAEANLQHLAEEVPNTGGRYRLSDAGLEQYLQYRERNNLGPPEYFAQGGAVGTDTIPAMLSPGEVVVPKSMVDGGAIDHLRGKLPGFASGGKVNTTANLAGQVLLGAPLTGMVGSTDPAEKINKLGDVIGTIGKGVGAAIPPLGAFIEGLGLGTKGLATFISAINETVDKYAEYSPDVAQAQALVEIRQTMADFRRANQIGPELAKFVVAQGELQQRYEEIKIKLLMKIVPAVTAIMEVIDKAMSSGEGIQLAVEALVTPLTAAAEAARKMANLQEDTKFPMAEDPTTLILNSKLFDISVGNDGGPGAIRSR